MKRIYKIETIPVLDKNGIWSFGETNEKKDLKSFEANLDFYTGVIAYGNSTLQLGYAEALYQTVNRFLVQTLNKKPKSVVLDLGVGVGRNIYDNAEVFNQSNFVAIDNSYPTLLRCKEILTGGEILRLDLTNRGFPILKIKCKQVSNVSFHFLSNFDEVLNDNFFDCILAINIFDRLTKPKKQLQQLLKKLKPNGELIFSTPLNFRKSQEWDSIKKEDVINILQEEKINIEYYVDSLPYQVLLDGRGSRQEWSTLFVHGIKNNNAQN